MAYGSRPFARLSIDERLKIGKQITDLKEVQKLNWNVIRPQFRNISTNTAKKLMAEYKATLVTIKK